MSRGCDRGTRSTPSASGSGETLVASPAPRRESDTRIAAVEVNVVRNGEHESTRPSAFVGPGPCQVGAASSSCDRLANGSRSLERPRPTRQRRERGISAARAWPCGSFSRGRATPRRTRRRSPAPSWSARSARARAACAIEMTLPPGTGWDLCLRPARPRVFAGYLIPDVEAVSPRSTGGEIVAQTAHPSEPSTTFNEEPEIPSGVLT